MKKNALFAVLALSYLTACSNDKSKIPVLSNEEILRIDEELNPVEDIPQVFTEQEIDLNPIDENLQVQIDSQAAAQGPKKLDKPNYSLPYIQFVDSVWTLANVEEDSIVNFEFNFENLGRKPLEIKRVEPTCGCTLADYPFLPLKTNEKGSIKGKVNTKGKAGKFYTTVLVHSSAENSPTLLKIQGNITAKARE